jgi:hypothetical protein
MSFECLEEFDDLFLAFFKRWPSAPSPSQHNIIVAFNGTLFWPFRAKAQRAQNTPDIALASPNISRQ